MKKDSEKQIVMQHFLCALVDVLGQQDALRALDEDADFYDIDTAAANSAFWKGMQKCYSVVENIRLTIEENIKRWHPSIDDFDLIDPARQKLVTAETKHTVITRSFSDLIVAYASLDRAVTRIPMAQVWPVLCAVMFCQMGALANGCAIRGGIDLGLGFEFAETDLYGPVLARAYALESEVAKYPRVVIGPRLHRFVDHVAESGYEGEFSTLNQSMAQNILRCFMRDTDGLCVLDFCGAAHHEWIKADSWAAVEMFDRATNFAVEQAARFSAKGVEKLAKRYGTLSEYMRSRTGVWRPPSSRAHA